jgi:hypothetical protein
MIQQREISFQYGTPFPTECYGGIEHLSCSNDAVWDELEDGCIRVASLCNRCKEEVESYIRNQKGGK